MNPSNFFSLNWLDLGKAIIMVVIATICARLIPIVDAGTLPQLTDLVQCLKVGIAAGLSYLFKNLLTNSAGKFLGGDK